MKQIKSLLIIFPILLPSFLLAQKDSVLIKEASFRYEYTEFVLEKTTKERLVKAATSGYMDLSNYYETVTETVVVIPARSKCKITEPVYKTVVITEKSNGNSITYEKQILVKKATIEKIEIPAEYGTVTKYVMAGIIQEGSKVKSDTLITTPAEYETYESWELKQKTTVKRIKIPAVYKMIE